MSVVDSAWAGFFGGNNSQLAQILDSTTIDVGTDAGYNLCKLMWIYHPLGSVLVEKPVNLALKDRRKISIDMPQKQEIIDHWWSVWDQMTSIGGYSLSADMLIRSVLYIKRAYGAAAIGIGTRGASTETPLKLGDVQDRSKIFINVFDPLNAAGSFVTDQDPNSPDFQKPLSSIRINGKLWDKSRTLIQFNGVPIYLAFQPSAYGYIGRSVFQRILFPLQSFVRSMYADSAVIAKCAVIVSKTKSGSAIQQAMDKISKKAKGEAINASKTNNTLVISTDEEIAAIDLTNVKEAKDSAKDSIIHDISIGSEVPRLLIKDEGLTNGFGEGKEDTKAISAYLESVRSDALPLVKWFEKICMNMAFTEEFFATLQARFPDDFSGMEYSVFYTDCINKFKSDWQELNQETHSELVDVEASQVEAMAKMMTILLPNMDSENRAMLIDWVQKNLNELPESFSTALELNIESLKKFEPIPVQMGGENEPKSDQKSDQLTKKRK